MAWNLATPRPASAKGAPRCLTLFEGSTNILPKPGTWSVPVIRCSRVYLQRSGLRALLNSLFVISRSKSDAANSAKQRLVHFRTCAGIGMRCA